MTPVWLPWLLCLSAGVAVVFGPRLAIGLALLSLASLWFILWAGQPTPRQRAGLMVAAAFNVGISVVAFGMNAT